MATLRRRAPISGGPEAVKRRETPAFGVRRKPLPNESRPRFAIIYLFVAFVSYPISPLFPTLCRLADAFLRGRYSPYKRKDLFRYSLYYDMVKDPTRSVFPEILPTDLSAAHDIFLGEYEAFRSEHSVPSFMEVDARAKRFDAQSKWKVL